MMGICFPITWSWQSCSMHHHHGPLTLTSMRQKTRSSLSLKTKQSSRSIILSALSSLVIRVRLSILTLCNHKSSTQNTKIAYRPWYGFFCLQKLWKIAIVREVYLFYFLLSAMAPLFHQKIITDAIRDYVISDLSATIARGIRNRTQP